MMNKKHNMTNTRLYKIWSCMKYRCNGKKYKQSYLYKDRGIKLYEPWNDFINFYEWAKDKYFEGSSIDRIDNNGNYEPNNCRFANNYTQANNKRNNVIIEYKKQRKTLAEWSKETGNKIFYFTSKIFKRLGCKKNAYRKNYKRKKSILFNKQVKLYVMSVIC